MASLLLYSLLTTASAGSIGGKAVQNTCEYNVYVKNTPSANGGYGPQFDTLEPGTEFYQTWTELTNGNVSLRRFIWK